MVYRCLRSTGITTLSSSAYTTFFDSINGENHLCCIRSNSWLVLIEKYLWHLYKQAFFVWVTEVRESQAHLWSTVCWCNGLMMQSQVLSGLLRGWSNVCITHSWFINQEVCLLTGACLYSCKETYESEGWEPHILTGSSLGSLWFGSSRSLLCFYYLCNNWGLF